ncbi:MAG: flagellar filament capping protein FliD [Actinomycetota bacterium]|nr:flagellar filament capping protein FliD [Actinomycetota bacterium]
MTYVNSTGSTSGSSSPFSSYSLNTSGSGPAVTFNGLISGINTQSMIQAIMAAYKLPQQDIAQQFSNVSAQVNDYQQISADLTSLQTAADSLSQTGLWNQMSASSSNSQVATATASAGAQAGTLSFNVDQLAQANVLISSNGVASASTPVAASSGSFLVSSGAAGYGVTSLAGSSLAVGAHTFDVTSALAGGKATGQSALASSVTITSGVNDQISANVNGTAYTFTIAAGTYTAGQLAQAVAASSNVGGTQLLQAQVGATGQLELGTTLLGSGASLQVTGGTALSSLGMATQSSVSAGSAGSVTFDGTQTAINNVNANSTTTLANASGGSVTLGVGAFGLSAGSFSAQNVSTGSGTLSDIVNNINSAGAGVTATAVQTSAGGSYYLQLAANGTGTGNDIVMDPTLLGSTLGSFNTVTAGQDAKIQVGGSSGYTVDSASNTVSGVMNGVSINLLSAQSSGSSPVTITVTPNASAMATQVQNLVDAANTALSDINKYAGYNNQTQSGGPLMGDPTLNQITNQILQSISQVTGSGTLDGAQAVGLTLSSSGTISFNQATFESAYAANPSAVQQMFAQTASLTPSSTAYSGSASLVYAPDGTPGGAYPVTITNSATQAIDSGSVSSTGTVTAAETLGFTQGSLSTSYSATAGESLSAIAAGLNQAFAQAGLNLYASANTVSGGTQLVVSSVGYGSAQSFSATSNNTAAGQTGLGGTGSASFSGTDVAGTINGVAATGNGQLLSIPSTSPTLPGLAINVTATGITSATNIGTFNYAPGIAGTLANVGNDATAPATGSLSSTISSLQTQATNLKNQYNSYTPMIQSEQTLLQQLFSQMETQLGGLQNQSQWLAGQISKLP